MSEFVLRDDLLDSTRRCLRPTPFEHTLESGMLSNRCQKIAEASVGQLRVIDQRHRHTGTYMGGALALGRVGLEFGHNERPRDIMARVIGAEP